MSDAMMDAWARARMRDNVDDLVDRLRVHGGTEVGIGPLVDAAIALLRTLRDERDQAHRSSVENWQRAHEWQREAIKMRSERNEARLVLGIAEAHADAAAWARDEALKDVARCDYIAAHPRQVIVNTGRGETHEAIGWGFAAAENHTFREACDIIMASERGKLS